MYERHGMYGTPEYEVWREIKKRCFNKKSIAYDRYGGRGITICDEWKNSFLSFFSDIGLKTSPKHSIDRINNDGNYEPGNCRWATRVQQAQNRRVYKTTKTGTSGVTFQCNKWVARISVNKNRINLGSFDKLSDAINARNSAQKKYW